MKIYKKYLNKSYMTRSMEKIKEIKYIVIHETLEKNSNIDLEYERINNLSYQDDIYYSIHYIIDSGGICAQFIPENEVSYSTNNIDLNYNVISIECCAKDENGKFSNKTIEKLVELLLYLKNKYNLSNNDILLHYDLTSTRCTRYYVDNKYEFYDILDKIKEEYSKV